MQPPTGNEAAESATWSLVETSRLFDMLNNPRPGHGLLGVSDPDLHCLDGRWSMFVGAMNNRFQVRLYEARLPEGADITDDRWQFVTDSRDRAVALGAPERGAWDSAGMHSPTYVRGTAHDRTVERIYYAGQLTRTMSGKRSRYAIGYLERSAGGEWLPHPEPVLSGDETRPSAMEPYVLWADGQWRMWYLACVGEVGRGEQPDYEMRYTTSEDGQHWAAPERFTDEAEGFFDNTIATGRGFSRMILARGTNLHGTVPFPSQGLWLADTAGNPAGRDSWQPFERLLDTDTAAEPWYAAGVCGPACVLDGDDIMHVFATGTHSPIPWYRAVVQQFRHRRRPLVAAPFYLATARFTFHRSSHS
ncbi:hypothetical protein [Nocardia carnea]|uniref:hypothetical protein n=1 Tax=Nocardia carnea TaxID=37328 RepID=UPI002454F9B3|nr:hypothetical protein [Nocardia carnea]